ncbi:MAG TPA: hypothetical protein VFE58_04690 [Tepidisphaeraceae bacterium]|nr:hypothetical protein [Tepidisphaeraceae bacterium]
MRRTRSLILLACAPVLLLPTTNILATVLTVETFPEGNSPYIVNKNETLSPGFLAQRESQFGNAYVQELITSLPPVENI